MVASVMSYHKVYSEEIWMNDSVEAYSQTINPKNTLCSISYEHRRGEVPNERQQWPYRSTDRSRRKYHDTIL